MSESKIKKIRVREAKERDRGLFRKLWKELLTEQHDQGSKVAPTDRTLSLYERLFDSYVNNAFEGIVLFVADKGVLMWGDSGSEIDHDGGKTATAWGSYALGEQKEQILAALEDKACELLKDYNFNGVLGVAFTEFSDRWETVNSVVYCNLADRPV